MLSTQGFVEDELGEIAHRQGLKVTADVGRQGNVITYRTYDDQLTLIGTVTVHFEESYASIVNYAGRDSGQTFRYGDTTQGLMNEICKNLKIEPISTEKEAEKDEGSLVSKSTVTTENEATRKKAAQDAFPFQGF